MRFLVDNALSYVLAKNLKEAGHNAVHVREFNLQSASDEEIFQKAIQEERIIISADTDFGTLLSIKNRSTPSVILFRHNSERRPEKQASLILKNLPSIKESLEKGSIVVFEQERLRIRSLPIQK